MDKILFYKYLENRCTDAELEEVIGWIKTEAGNLPSREMVKKLWEEYAPEHISFNEARYARILDHIHHFIKLRAAAELKARIERQKRLTNRIFVFASKAAAILFLPVLATLIWVLAANQNHLAMASNDNIEVTAPVGSRTYIELPDGTGVHLNHGSRLTYPQRFSGRERRVKLHGEAYFTVAHDPAHPFKVDAGTMVVTALGTKFNVMAYPGQPYMETTLVDGKTVVEKKLSGNRMETLSAMAPGQHLRLNLLKPTFSVQNADVRKYISWKDGALVFKDDPLVDIVARLERWFNVEFVIRDEKLKSFPYTATFVDETLPQILDLLQLATPMKYQITPRIKQPDGSFSKSVVIIDSKMR